MHVLIPSLSFIWLDEIPNSKGNSVRWQFELDLSQRACEVVISIDENVEFQIGAAAVGPKYRMNRI